MWQTAFSPGSTDAGAFRLDRLRLSSGACKVPELQGTACLWSPFLGNRGGALVPVEALQEGSVGVGVGFPSLSVFWEVQVAAAQGLAPARRQLLLRASRSVGQAAKFQLLTHLPEFFASSRASSFGAKLDGAHG